MLNLNLWQHKEKYLILEILPGKIGGSLISLDSDRNIVTHKAWDDFSWSKVANRVRLRQNRKIIIAAHSSLATTISIPVNFERENSKDVLGEVELENFLAQSIGKVFNRCREEASRELKIGELDTILVSSRVLGFKIDGHQVINPIGFKAKMVEAVLELTLTTRDVFDKINFLVAAGKDFFFTELGRAEVLALRKSKKPPFGFIALGEGLSYFFILDRDAAFPVVRRGRFRWSFSEFFRLIADVWSLNPETALKIYDVYLKGQMSESVARSLEKILKPAVQHFFEEASGAKLRGSVFVDSSTGLPFSLPKRWRSIQLETVPFLKLMDKLGLKWDIKGNGMTEIEAMRRLASFLEFYYDNSDQLMNARLKRRLHWLHPNA